MRALLDPLTLLAVVLGLGFVTSGTVYLQARHAVEIDSAQVRRHG